jgi:hypothetical protein
MQCGHSHTDGHGTKSRPPHRSHRLFHHRLFHHRLFHHRLFHHRYMSKFQFKQQDRDHRILYLEFQFIDQDQDDQDDQDQQDQQDDQQDDQDQDQDQDQDHRSLYIEFWLKQRGQDQEHRPLYLEFQFKQQDHSPRQFDQHLKQQHYIRHFLSILPMPWQNIRAIYCPKQTYRLKKQHQYNLRQFDQIL